MKILFCTKNDIFGASILNFILPRLAGHEVRVFLSDKTRSAENTVPELVEEKFLERDFPLNVVFPAIDAGAGEGELLTFKGCARKYGVSIEISHKINSPESEQQIRAWGPDVIVSARFSLIFKGNIERIPRHGIYNIHPGALPGYAGLCAPLRGLVNGEEKLGCTLHKIDMGIDTGPIHSVSYMPATPSASVFSHIAHLYEMGLTRLLEVLQTLDAGRQPQMRQQTQEGFRYYHLPGSDVFAEMQRLGISPVSFDAYSALVRRFCPDSTAPELLKITSPDALERATADTHVAGIDGVVERLRASVSSDTRIAQV